MTKEEIDLYYDLGINLLMKLPNSQLNMLNVLDFHIIIKKSIVIDLL